MAVNRVDAAVVTWCTVFQMKHWQVAADLGVSPQFLSHWQRGRRMPSTLNRARMARYFGLESGDDLIGTCDPEFLESMYRLALDTRSRLTATSPST